MTLPRVLILAGESVSCRWFCARVLAGQFEAQTRTVDVDQFREEALSPCPDREVLVLDNAHEAAPNSWLTAWAKMPSTPNRLLALLSPETSRAWAPKSVPRKLTWVPCNPLTPDAGAKLFQWAGMKADEIAWALKRCGGDSELMLELADLYTYGGGPVQAYNGLLRRPESGLDPRLGIEGETEVEMAQSAARRLMQAAIVARHRRNPAPQETLAEKAGLKVWRFQRFRDLTRQWSPDDLMAKAEQAVQVEQLAHRGAPTARLLRAVCAL